jgi:hypothetical protein
MRVLLALLLLTGCAAMQSGAASVLKPSMVSPTFKDLDNDKKNPFIKPPNRIEVQKVGIVNYDKFFQESAEVKGTVILADVVLTETDQFVAKTKKELAGGKAMTPAQQAALKKEQARVDAITKLVADVPAKSQQLLGQGEGLTKSAPATFVGPNAFKLPGVMKGLDQSMNAVKDAAARSPGVLDHAAKTTAALASL